MGRAKAQKSLLFLVGLSRGARCMAALAGLAGKLNLSTRGHRGVEVCA